MKTYQEVTAICAYKYFTIYSGI